jgi:surfeit locus 1 family protein
LSHDLTRPRWLIAHVVIVGLAAGFGFLGLWQLDRHSQRIEENRIGGERMALAPIELDRLLDSEPLQRLEFRRVTVTGAFMPEDEVLVRSQVHLGTAGFHVITPLATEDGRGVLVNRGWVPFTLGTTPVVEAPPPDGVVTIEGWVRMSQQRPAAGVVENPGRLTIISRVDVERLREQTPLDLAPVYVVMSGTRGELPEPLREPRFDDNGPHLAYAIQWFGFAAVGLVGYVFLLRRQIRQPAGERARSSTTS